MFGQDDNACSSSLKSACPPFVHPILFQHLPTEIFSGVTSPLAASSLSILFLGWDSLFCKCLQLLIDHLYEQNDSILYGLDIVWEVKFTSPPPPSLNSPPNYQNVLTSFSFKTGRHIKLIISQHFPDTIESAQSTMATVYTAFQFFLKKYVCSYQFPIL